MTTEQNALLLPASPARQRTAARKTLTTALLAAMVLLVAPGPAISGTEIPPAGASASIRQFWFSLDTFAEVDAEFDKLGLVFSKPLTAPLPGMSTRAIGTGPSGFPAPYVIDHVRGRFNVYVERRRPQHPVGALPYFSQEVIFSTPDPRVSPVGTLTYPSTGSNFPAVVLVAGTGAHTRDAGMSLHKTLWVLSDHLTRQGFAVLRYDKRGIGLTGGALHPGSTTDDYLADALAAARFLTLQPNIDARNVGIVGHSEGGIIAAMAAAQAPQDIAFIVMLAGTGMPGIDLKSLQDATERRGNGMPEPLVRLNESQERGLLEIAAGKLEHDQAISAMVSATDALPADVKRRLEVPAEGIPVHAYEDLLAPWFRRFLQIDPRTYLAQVKSPVLALVGEKDVQVPPTENLEGISTALASNGNPKTRVLQIAGMNHNLQAARTGKPNEYLLIEETVSPSVLAVISTWLRDVVGVRN